MSCFVLRFTSCSLIYVSRNLASRLVVLCFSIRFLPFRTHTQHSP
jgi:hypothetical protein